MRGTVYWAGPRSRSGERVCPTLREGPLVRWFLESQKVFLKKQNITDGIGNANPFHGELAETLGLFAKNACPFANLLHKRRDATFGSYLRK